ncbi:MAG: hypothetical protein ABW321_25665 [Polyangiales bacterium]
MLYLRRTLALLTFVCSSPALAQQVEPPVVLGTLAGDSSPQGPVGVQFYGTDLGWTFRHENQLVTLFGDSWRDQNSVCAIATTGLPTNDDALAIMPLERPSGVPELVVITQHGAQGAFEPIELMRDGVRLAMGLDRTPLTGFSDGVRPIGVFQSARFVRCYEPPTLDGDGSCTAPLRCERQLGECFPSPFGIPQLCDAEHQTGCVSGQVCMLTGPGYCIDRSSSQGNAVYQVPLEVELAVPRSDSPANWESKATFTTNKLYNMTARTVRNLGDDGGVPDYRPGDKTVLMWGRPGFRADPGLDTGLYLMAHDLPFTDDASGKFVFTPRFFAGVDRLGVPVWSSEQDHAVPLALDGKPNGDPRETAQAVNQMAISWLDAPIKKWIMLYSGGTLTFPGAPAPDNGSIATGAIAVRFADHPWGPWTPPQTYWDPGSPTTAHAAYGPGGVMFHPSCVDQGPLACTRSDPIRPADMLNQGCAPTANALDTGFFYASNIIDAYTEANDRGGLDIYWNLSTWNPYRVLYVRSTVLP